MRYSFKIIALTLAYWLYESRQGGNIRVDILIFYPLMVFFYTKWLWPKHKWLSPFITAVIMVVNFYFMQHSYAWFTKYPG